ncbi:hypothetical protein [Specibacter sp. NPDC078709]|uniref:hypothetical protein n=1 Tax=Specibacter sp. NPDC078709 TaxID=3154364 RepID=UPI0034247541
MSTQKCSECQAPFEPRLSVQLYCSATCSARSRQRRHREKQRATSHSSAQTLVALERANGNARLLNAEKQHLRSLQSGTSIVLSKSQETILARDRVIDEQRTQLQQLATRYFDQSGQLAEAKAESVELQLEVSRVLKDRRADLQDLMQIAVRMLQLTDHLGIPLDRPTSDIFHRRGWNTKITEASR